MLMTLHSLLLHYLVRGDLITLSEKETRMIQYGFAYFGKEGTIQVDEPLVLLAAKNWLAKEQFTLDRYLGDTLRHSAGRGSAWEDFLAIYFVQAFENGQSLDKVFQFYDPVPPWSCESAQIVTLSITGEDICVSQVDMSQSRLGGFGFGYNVAGFKDDLEWFKNPRNTPFLFPSNYLGPDIVFVLQLSNERLVWVVVQARYCSELWLGEKVAKDAMRTLTPDKFYLHKVSNSSVNVCPYHPHYWRFAQDGKAHAHKAMPRLKETLENYLHVLPTAQETGFGKFSLLRVIASFLADPILGSVALEDKHPLATLMIDNCIHTQPETSSILEVLQWQVTGKRKADTTEMYEGPHWTKRNESHGIGRCALLHTDAHMYTGANLSCIKGALVRISVQ
jgi:hypothetical protein